jgi:hypothetical protein
LLHPTLVPGIDFVFLAIGISIVVRAVRGGGRRYRDFPQPQQPTLLQDPRVPQLQAEMDELRAQVERLNAAENFYAQLNAPPPAASAPPPVPPAPPGPGA